MSNFSKVSMLQVKLLLCLLMIVSFVTLAQNEKGYSEYKNKFALDPVIMVDKAGVLSRGLFLDLEGDSLKLLVNSKVTMLALSSIKFFKIFSQVRSRDNMLGMGIAGAFIVQLLLPKDEYQSDRFIQSNGMWAHVLIGSLGAVAGGLIGLGFDRSSDEKEMGYDLENPSEVLKMRRDLVRKESDTKVNFYYEISKVYTRTDPTAKQTSGYFNNYNSFALNVFRSIRLTYNITPHIEAGLSMYSVAEPNLKYTTNSQNNISDEMHNAVYGYYLTAWYDPIRFSNEEPVSVKTGIGAGFATINYTISRSWSIFDPVKFTTTVTTESNKIEKTALSAFTALEVRFFPTKKVSIALTGDYIYLPEKTLASIIPDEGGKSFGNFSLGVSLGLHF